MNDFYVEDGQEFLIVCFNDRWDRLYIAEPI